MTLDRLPLNARRLALFVTLSLLAHLLLIGGWRPLLPAPEEQLEPTLTARLQPAPAPKPRRHIPPPAAAPTETAPTAPVITTSAPQSAAAANAAAAGTASAGDTNVATAPATPETVRALPRRGEIKYTLYYGDAGWIVGQTLQTWNIDHGHYRFTSHSATGGLVWLFSRQHLDYESDGEITPDGLRPTHFAVERRRSGVTEQTTADFDWNAMAVTLDAPPRTVALPPGAQDMVSFMYQLGLTALQPGFIELPITNGWKLERYRIEIGAAETIDTPLGKLKAIPVRQIVAPGRDSVELWLATDYRMLPARIRFYGRDGEPAGEQLVSDIRVSDE
ncbi:MAG TPA: DUF3108 domain-containing protein [Burkholderiales bacterium]|nr:DUF3108 domain-containing protein [Burkholderiales bacterium]